MNKEPNPIDVTAGERLRNFRMVREMSQEQLANATGIAQQQIQKYERGTNRISASRLKQFADILDIPVAFFFAGEAPFTVLPENKQEFELLAAFRAMPESARSHLVSFAKGLTS